MADKNKSANGVSLFMLILSCIGGICSLIYVVVTKQYIIVPNFLCGVLGLAVVLYYKIKDIRKGKSQ